MRGLHAAEFEPSFGVFGIRFHGLLKTRRGLIQFFLLFEIVTLLQRLLRILWSTQGCGAHSPSFGIGNPVYQDCADIRALRPPWHLQFHRLRYVPWNAGAQLTDASAV